MELDLGRTPHPGVRHAYQSLGEAQAHQPDTSIEADNGGYTRVLPSIASITRGDLGGRAAHLDGP